jgi:hypothetical protein
MVAPMVGSGGVCLWQESGFSCREDVFTFNLFIKKFYKFCTFSAIFKDNAAINCITVQHKKGSFPSTLTGHTLLLLKIRNNIVLCTKKYSMDEKKQMTGGSTKMRLVDLIFVLISHFT